MGVGRSLLKLSKGWESLCGINVAVTDGNAGTTEPTASESRGGNVEEFSQILQQFQEVETQLRGNVTQQQEFFRDISRGIESGFAEVCQRLGVMETTISGLLQKLTETPLMKFNQKLSYL